MSSSSSNYTLSLPASPPMVSASAPTTSHFTPAMAIVIILLMVSFLIVSLFALYMGLCAQSGRFSYRTSPNGTWRPFQLQAAAGLDPSVVAALPVCSYSRMKGWKQGRDSRECAVCLTEFGDDEKIKVLPKCGHGFHPSCIDMWLASHTTCPICRKNLTSPFSGDPSSNDGRRNQPLAGRDALQHLEDQYQGLFMETTENPATEMDQSISIKIDDPPTAADEGTSEIREHHANTQLENDNPPSPSAAPEENTSPSSIASPLSDARTPNTS